jgi:hypothetical protein
MNDPFEEGRRDGRKIRRLAGLGREDGGHHVRCRLAVERALACREFVQHAAESEDVRADVHLASLDLLGRHVLWRAHDRVRASQRGDGRLFARLAGHRPGLGQAEVEELDAAF